MRVIALEEHVGNPALVSRLPGERVGARGWPAPDKMPPIYSEFNRRIAETGAKRIARMDYDGVDVQVLSVTGPGADILPPDAAPAFARDYNDYLAEVVKVNPDRFAAFAHLPLSAPEAAADEFERTVVDYGFCGALVNGTTDGAFLDDLRFEPLLARAARLNRPIYIHPAPPPKLVREAYYDGLPGFASPILATGGWGWHAETAVHILRLALSGAFDRHRDLKVIIGHMGEGLPAMLARFDDVLSSVMSDYMQRGVAKTILDQVWVSTSGFVAGPAFNAALATFGPHRMMFGIDYPFTPGKPQVDFLHAIDLPSEDVSCIAHANAEALMKLAPKGVSSRQDDNGFR